MYTGKVRWFNNQRGYGFLISEDGKAFFVHYSDINSTEKRKKLTDGETVVFDVIDTEKGRQAINVTVVTSDATIEE